MAMTKGHYYRWDLWTINALGAYHVFFLRSVKTITPQARHDTSVSIGHAQSKDLSVWHELPLALTPGSKGTWDDHALWSGCCIKKGKVFYMFYTSRNHLDEDRWIQRIGVATSNDLTYWEKYSDNPILEADTSYYEMDNKRNDNGTIDAWRDPFVWYDATLKKYAMAIAARKKQKPDIHNACIGLAVSDDLFSWQVMPPLFTPSVYDEMETPQVIFCNKRYYVFFLVSQNSLIKKTNLLQGDESGLHCFYSTSLKGPFKPVNKTGLVLPFSKGINSVRLLSRRGNTYKAIGWPHDNSWGTYMQLSRPFNITIDGDRITTSLD